MKPVIRVSYPMKVNSEDKNGASALYYVDIGYQAVTMLRLKFDSYMTLYICQKRQSKICVCVYLQE